MRRSTLFAVSLTATVLIVCGQWPAIVGDSGLRGARAVVSRALAWRPEARIAPRGPSASIAPRRLRPGPPAEVMAAVGAGASVAAGIAIVTSLAWALRALAPRRRRQPLDAARWLARELGPAR